MPAGQRGPTHCRAKRVGASRSEAEAGDEEISAARAGRRPAGRAPGGAPWPGWRGPHLVAGRRARGSAERGVELAAQDLAQERRAPRAERRRPAGRSGTAPRPRRGRRPRAAPSAPQRTQRSSSGRTPSAASTFQKKAGTTSGDGCAASVRSAPEQHLVEVGHRARAPGSSWSTASSSDEARVSRSRSSHERPGGSIGLGLADDVELAALVEQQASRGSAARAGRRSGSSSCARPWPRPAPCRARP